jgi:hypothetical protein
VHGSIWTYRGDPEQLLEAYDGLIAEILPAVQLHLCLRTPDGIVLVDTCPDEDSFARFAASDDFRALRARHGLPEPDCVHDFPVHAAIVDGAERARPALEPGRAGGGVLR